MKVNTDNHATAFTVSIDHVDTTTGISAEERGYTCRKCVDPDTRPEDLRRPGPCVPPDCPAGAACWCGGGHTEATVDLCRLAGLVPCGLCCEIMRGRRHHDAHHGALGEGRGVGAEGADHPGPSGLLPPPRQACGP